MMAKRKRVVVVGAGFGGLFAARALADTPVDVLLIDRNNYHTFTPLLYQVATCALDPSQIAYPVRSIFRKNDNVEFLLGTVTGIDTDGRRVTVQTSGGEYQEAYDYLLLATGSVTSFFGREDIRAQAYELRTLDDAIRLRNHVLSLFEQASWAQDYGERQALLTIVVVGGGPTGIETAGAIYELYNHVLDKEYPQRDMHARVVLVEMQDHLLRSYPERLQAAALRQLRSLGVEVRLGSPVETVEDGLVTLADGTRIDSHTVVWAAGPQAAPEGGLLGVPLQSAARVVVDAHMRVLGVPGVYSVGDMTYLEDPQQQPYPMLIPVAQQQALLAAANILKEVRDSGDLKAFSYLDRGMMATIGRRRAVAWLYNKVQVSGYLAWVVWLFFHLMTLLGFRNRISVFMNWVWIYFTYDRSVRIILRSPPG